jgi:preprotein translocase subunit SecD
METILLRILAISLALALPAAAAAQELRFNVIQESLGLSKADIEDAKAEMQAGQWVVAIRLSDAAKAKFGEITARNVRKAMQVVVGDRIISAPIILEPIRGGNLNISGNMSEADAKAIAAKLKW